ncbi:hypothetical protein [Streptomyces phaeofaciens]|uniref:hypothetical protein n=1 Tax=Streptomyces phaeofaciens TaxID=68254 RepID=UPI001672E151|nr:hypothetical protein [Streptomyces phaeofaciens]
MLFIFSGLFAWSAVHRRFSPGAVYRTAGHPAGNGGTKNGGAGNGGAKNGGAGNGGAGNGGAGNGRTRVSGT